MAQEKDPFDDILADVEFEGADASPDTSGFPNPEPAPAAEAPTPDPSPDPAPPPRAARQAPPAPRSKSSAAPPPDDEGKEYDPEKSLQATIDQHRKKGAAARARLFGSALEMVRERREAERLTDELNQARKIVEGLDKAVDEAFSVSQDSTDGDKPPEEDKTQVMEGTTLTQADFTSIGQVVGPPIAEAVAEAVKATLKDFGIKPQQRGLSRWLQSRDRTDTAG